MATQVQFRRGSTTQHNSFTGAVGEMTINLTNVAVRVHDGITVGGVEMARRDLLNVSGNLYLPNANLTVGNLQVLSRATIANVKYPANAGTTGQILTTDGTGNAYWANASAVANGANRDVQYVSNGQLQGNSNFQWDNANTNLKVSGNIYSGSDLTFDLGTTTLRWRNIYLSSVRFANGGNITGNSDGWLNVSNNFAVAGDFMANNANFGNLIKANYIQGTLVANSNNQPNITTLGVLTNLTVTGNSIFSSSITGTSANFANNITANGNIQANGNLFSDRLTSITGDLYLNATGNNKSIYLDPTGNGTVNVSNSRISNVVDPTESQDAATKAYVDAVAQGLAVKEACDAATTASLVTILGGGTVTYNNGSSGVGATLTLSAPLTQIDNVTLTNGMRILVKNEGNQAHNGVYVRTSSQILTRATDFDTSNELSGGFVFIISGTVYKSAGFVQTEKSPVLGTNNVKFTQFSGAGTYTAGTGLALNGTEFLMNNTAVGAGSYGNGTHVAGFTVDQQGRLTAANSTAITANSELLTGTFINNNVNGSNLTSVGTLTSLTVSGSSNLQSVQANGTLTSNGVITAKVGITSNGNITVANSYYFKGDGSLLTNLQIQDYDVTRIVNGSSNVVVQANANVTVAIAGTPNVMSIGDIELRYIGSANIIGNIRAGDSLIVGGNANITGNLSADHATFTGNVNADTIRARVGNLQLIPTSNTDVIDATTHRIVNVVDPQNRQDAATKAYVDDFLQGLSLKASVVAATTASLETLVGGTVSYSNGPDPATPSVGSFIVLSQPLNTVDGWALSDAERILVKDQTNKALNGIYTIDATYLILTRATDFDLPSEIPAGSYTFVLHGTTYEGTQWAEINEVTAIGAAGSPIEFEQFAGKGTYTAGAGLNLSNSVFSVANTTVTAASYGNATHTAQFTVNERGQLTAAANVAITANSELLTGTFINSDVQGSNLTSVGTLVNLIVSGNTTANNITSNSITANGNITVANSFFFIGDGGLLSNLTAANGPNGSIQFAAGNKALDGSANLVFDVATNNLNVSANINTVGNITIANGNYFIGDGRYLTNLTIDTSKITNGNSNVRVLQDSNVVFTVSNVDVIDVRNQFVSNIDIQSNTSVISNVFKAIGSNTLVIQSGTGNSNIILQPQGTGTINASNARIVDLGNPQDAQDAATKSYVDALAQGLAVHAPCDVATTATLETMTGGTVTYDNGTVGVAAKLTFSNNLTAVDNITLTSGMRILVKDQDNKAHNGIYTWTPPGNEIIRAEDFDTFTEISGGDFTFILSGTLYGNTGYVESKRVTTMGTDPIEWIQFFGPAAYTGGNGIQIIGTGIHVRANLTHLENITVNTSATIANLLANIANINSATITNLVATTANITTITNQDLTVSNLANIENLVANTANITTITNQDLTVSNLANIANLVANTANITTITNQDLTVSNLANIANLVVNTASFFDISVSNLATLNVATANLANIENLVANTATVTTATVTTATVTDLAVGNLADLGQIANLRVYGGNSGQLVSTDGNGNLSFQTVSFVTGPNTSVQFNDNNAFAGSNVFTFNKDTNTVAIIGNISLVDPNGNYTAWRANSNTIANVTYALPARDGNNNGELLATDANGSTYWRQIPQTLYVFTRNANAGGNLTSSVPIPIINGNVIVETRTGNANVWVSP